jgi:hypothetical protein
MQYNNHFEKLYFDSQMQNERKRKLKFEKEEFENIKLKDFFKPTIFTNPSKRQYR